MELKLFRAKIIAGKNYKWEKWVLLVSRIFTEQDRREGLTVAKLWSKLVEPKSSDPITNKSR